MKAVLTVYKFVGDSAQILKRVELDQPKASLLSVLAAFRAGLPSDCGATLVDGKGHNIRP